MADKQRRTRQLESYIGSNPLTSGAPGGQVRPYADPQAQTAAHRQSLSRESRVALGTITDGTALAHAYRVSVEGVGPIVATMIGHTAFTNIGAKQINTLQPGIWVVVLLHPELSYGIILGTLPGVGVSAKDGMSDLITQASRTREDEAHKRPLKMEENGGVRDWLSGRPFDGTLGGEAGYISGTGTKLTVDDFLVQLAVSEACGVFGFYHDELLRISGLNLQLWTSGSEREGFNDEGEYNDWTGFTPYPWEALGLSGPGDPKTEKNAQAQQLCEPWYSIWEPRKDHQMPFHRVRIFHGYAGQGGHVMVAAPPKSKPELFTYKTGTPGSASAAHSAAGCGSQNTIGSQNSEEPKPLIGLFTQATTLDGRHGIRSAKGVLLTKRLLIPQPYRLKRPEDGEGNTATNYRACGQDGSGPEHKITGDIAAEYKYPQMQRASGVLDLHAHFFNYGTLHPFQYRDKDFKLPEESQLDHADTNQKTPEFKKLADDPYLDPPEPVSLPIDHRYNEQKYYPNESFISLLDDGGIVIRDGFGASITMTGGNITFAAPGDILLKTGRTAQIWGGHDVILKARNSLDISASDHDVRIKAERNLMLLGGNDGEDGSTGTGRGGILLESRAAAPIYEFEKVGEDVDMGGIVLRSPKADVVTLSRGVYLRTGGGDLSQGPIVLDANRGKSQIIFNCKDHFTYADNSILQLFGPQGNPEKVNAFGKTTTILGTNLAISGQLIVNGSTACKGGLAVAGGGIAVENGSPFVGKLEGTSLNKIHGALADVQTAQETLVDTGKEFFKTGVEERYYDNEKVGNDKTIQSIQFGHRTTEQYKTKSFVLFEDHWQQMARLAGQTLPKWKEKPVVTLADPKTYPYPGKTAFEEDSYIQQELTIHDPEKGRSHDRGSADSAESKYTEPKYGEAKPVSLKEYTVVTEGMQA